MKTIRKTTTLTRITKKGGKIIRRYRKTATMTRRVKSAAAAPSQNLDD